jgi:uncharacterized protein
MWAWLAGKLLRNRTLVLSILVLLTLYFGYRARNLEISYGLPKLLPDHDSTSIAYEKFKENFGREGIVYIIGIEKDPLKDLHLFNAWRSLGLKLNAIDGIDTVVSVTNNIFTVVKNTEEKKFEIKPIVTSLLETSEELDSIRTQIHSLPFYKNRLYNDSSNVSLMYVTLDSTIFNSESRNFLVDNVMATVAGFEEAENIKLHISGLPFIRTIISKIIRSEMGMFVFLAFLVTALILFIFFRSPAPVLISLFVVITGVVWSVGIMGMLDYKITILTSLIPPLIIVIGVPNCIFLINKYHREYRNHENQAKSLTRVIQKVGAATLMTNATTAVGFATFIPADTAVLREFGIVSSINILAIFFISLIIIPICLSYIRPPKEKHTRHLERTWISGFINKILFLVSSKRRWIYVAAAVLFFFSVIGISKIEITGNLVDDLPENHVVLEDLRFFETNFKGVMPFEVLIDAQKPGLAIKDHTLKKIEQFQEMMSEYPQFSNPLSIVEGIKFTKQAFYGGNPEKYELINNQEKAFFKPYVEGNSNNNEWMTSIIDTAKQVTRISYHMADVGTKELEALVNEIRPKTDSIFNPEKYSVNFTGSSMVFLKGTTYLVKSLFVSLAIALVLIGAIMASMFASSRMVIISMATNLFPLCLTAALMGYLGIGIKPSTILVFSIAFGISVDDTIHFLAKYRQELRTRNFNIGESVRVALKDAGVSMAYTSIILFFGFSVFISSDFGGTKAMGLLVSFTLMVAMLSNLILLPSFLLTLEKAITTRAFQEEPLLQIFDEEEDIEEEQLQIKKTTVPATELKD